MLVKVNDGYLDLMPGESIEIEQQVKLFEEISTIDGDYSWDFDCPDTAHNKNLLGITDINLASKSIYTEIPCEIQNNDGATIHKGLLKVEQYIGTVISCSFLSGNSNWIQLIQGSLKDLDLSGYDVANTLTNAEASWTATSGIVWPLIDKGKLDERIGAGSLVFDERVGEDLYLNNDFHPFIFVKDVFSKIFSEAGLKISGNILNDYVYNNLITTNNPGNSQDVLNDRSCYVGKTSAQSLTNGVFTKISFIDNVDPYYDGDENNFDTGNNRWTADVDCIAEISTSLIFSSSQRYTVDFYKNGVSYRSADFYPQGGGLFKLHAVQITAGDYFEVHARPFTSTADCNVGSYFQVKVIRVNKVFAVDLVPDWNRIDFVKNIFKMLNVVSIYDPYTQTVNLELFKNIKNKTPQDITPYVSDVEFDYYEFINNYGKKNTFTYSDSSTEEIETYNDANVDPFGAGAIEVENSYLKDLQELVSLDFVAPYQYYSETFKTSLLKLNYLGDDTETVEDQLTSVTDNGGVARFNFASSPPFGTNVGDIIKIKETSTGTYVGTAVISVDVANSFELAGVLYQGNATGTFVKVNYTNSSNQDPVVAIYVRSMDINAFSDTQYQAFYINEDLYFSMAFAYFFKQQSNGGLDADQLKQGLSFGEINEPRFYQQTLIETYYDDFSGILKDPVKATATCNLPEAVFKSLDFTRPVYLNHKKAQGYFYLNKISGYKESSKSCRLELIKISRTR